MPSVSRVRNRQRTSHTGAMPHVCAAREKVVGWYSTGPKLKEADLDINALLSKFTESGEPVLVICEVQVGLQIRRLAWRMARAVHA